MNQQTRQNEANKKSEAYRLGYAHGLKASQLASPSTAQLEMVYDKVAYKSGFKAGQRAES